MTFSMVPHLPGNIISPVVQQMSSEKTLPAVLQELFVKGIVEDNITASCKKYNKHFSVWMTALFFFVLHMGYNLPMMFGAAVLCVVTGYLYEKNKSVWGSILIHFVIGFVPKIVGVSR